MLRHVRREIFVIAGLIVAIIACYGPVGGHEFVNYDDHRYITRNARVQQGLSLDNIAWAFTTFEAANWHPLTWMSHMLDVSLFGSRNAGAHHLMNVAWHIANSIVLFLALRRMTGRADVWRAALVAGLFALHPLHVESVAWVSERKDVLSTFFGLLAIAAYVGYAARPSLRRYIWIAVAFALSLMSKPMLVTLPFVLLLLDYWPLKRLACAGEAPADRSRIMVRWSVVLEKIPLLLMSLASSIVTMSAQTQGGAVSSLESVPLSFRASNALVAYGTYLWQTLRPVDLIPFYPLPKSWPGVTVLVALVALGLITAITVALYRKRPALVVGWLWYLGTLVPVIGLIQVGSQAHADRYTYVPLIGVFIMMAWGVPAAWTKGAAWLYGIVATVILALLGYFTFLQAGYWRDSITLSTYALRAGGPNGVIEFNLANALMEAGETDRAIAHLQSASRLMPGWHDIPFNLGNAYLRQGQFDEAVAAYDESLRRKPGFVSAMINRAIAQTSRGERAAAIDLLRRAVSIDPGNPDAHRTLGQFLAEENRLDEASQHFHIVLGLAPNDAAAHLLLGNVLARQNRLEDAVRHFEQSLRANPNEARAHMSLAAALRDTGRPELALRHLQIAAELAATSGRGDLIPEIQRRIQRLGETGPPP